MAASLTQASDAPGFIFPVEVNPAPLGPEAARRPWIANPPGRGGDFILWGSSGHAKVIADLLFLEGARIAAFVDRNPETAAVLDDLPLFRSEPDLRAWLASPAGAQVGFAALAIGGSRGRDRREIGTLLRSLGLHLPTLIHPDASVSRTATLGEGTHVLAQAVIAADTVIGRCCVVNHGAIVDHETELEAGVHVAPGATLCGCIQVGEDAMIGAGATVLPRLRIGARAIVGAGATVTRDVPPDCVVTGTPAHPVSAGRRTC
jgi:sugar O-acyltransferase (sialic acid O-acetyltransferase NeuD family)